MIGKTVEKGYLSEDDVFDLCSEALSTVDLKDKRILVIIPDHTRSAPIGLFFRIIHRLIGQEVKNLDCLVALGTHPYLSEEEILRRVEITAEEWKQEYSY